MSRQYSDSEIEAIVEENRLLKQKDSAVDDFLIITKTDPSGIITYANKSFVEISGYSKEELIGQPHSIVRHPDVSPNLFKGLWAKIKDRKETWRGALKNITKGGETYYVESMVSPIFDSKGEIIEYISLRKDITKRVIREQELNSERRFTERILNYQDSIILLTNEQQGLLDVNQKFFDYVEFESIAGFKEYFKCIGDLFIPEEEMIYSCAIDWVEYIFHKRNEPHQAKLIDKHGRVRYFSIKVDKIQASKSRMKRYNLSSKDLYIMTLHDVTELETALQKAKAGTEAKSRFLANMSHEIRTPLNGILGFAELLKKTKPSETQDKYISTITSSSKTLLGIINDILDFSKVESGNMSLEYIKFNPVTEFEPTLSLFSAKMVEKRISYILFVDPYLPKWIILDPLRLKQVISNLIGNALKFTPEGGIVNVDITFDRVDEHNINLNISVKDSGIGISPEQQKRIFTPFSQADESTTRKFGGTGLGLSISKSFIELMGGSLKLDSAVGEGSRFFFSIKAEAAPTQTFDYNWLGDLSGAIYHSPKIDVEPEVELLQRYLERFGLKTAITSDKATLDQSDAICIFSKSVDAMDLRSLEKHLEHRSIILIDSYEKRSTKIRASKIRRLTFPFSMSGIYDAVIENFNKRDKRLEKEQVHLKEAINFDGIKVLVVEDNEVNQMFIELLLKEYKISVDIANNGKEGVQMVSDNSYSLVLMDINMPILGGVEATKQIRQFDSDKRGTPIVALTANAMVGDKERFISAGMSDYMTKPVDVADLERILLKYLPRGIEKDSNITEIENYNQDKEILMIAVPENSFEEVSKEVVSQELGIPEMFVDKLVGKFLEGVDEGVADLEKAIADGDSEQIKDFAHKIKGSAANLRFKYLAEIMKTIEYAGKDGVTDGYGDIVAAAKSEIEVVKSKVG
jgi:PAS domain S-box-containing protein